MTEELDVERLLQKVRESQVEYVWHMSEDAYHRIKRIKDNDGNHLASPGDYGQRWRLLGLRIVFVDGVDDPRIAVVLPFGVEFYSN